MATGLNQGLDLVGVSPPFDQVLGQAAELNFRKPFSSEVLSDSLDCGSYFR
jgi:hypothetical protein